MFVISYDSYYQDWTCCPCNRTFNDRYSLDQHFLKSSLHDWCSRCERDFNSAEQLRNHLVKVHFFCDPCNTFHRSKSALDEHYIEFHFLCQPCGRFFGNRNNLNQHLASAVHKPKSFRCPMAGCSAAFVSTSAAILHCEQGRCPSGITRQQIDRLISQWDRNGMITDPSRMLEGPSGRRGYPYEPEPTYTATEKAWNGEAYECYFCHRTWPRLNSLQAHLSSGMHSATQGMYHCPPNGCQAKFAKLSALVQHIEHGSCGVRRFQYVDRAIQSLTSGMRALTAA
jgi:hypothetical protein